MGAHFCRHSCLLPWRTSPGDLPRVPNHVNYDCAARKAPKNNAICRLVSCHRRPSRHIDDTLLKPSEKTDDVTSPLTITDLPTEAFDVKFVGVVEKYPALYNSAFKDNTTTEWAWSVVAWEVNLPVNDAKEKWRNLLSSFVRNLKNPTPRQCGVREKKSYDIMDAMKFVIPFLGPLGNPTGNLTESSCTPNHNTEVQEHQDDSDEEMDERPIDASMSQRPIDASMSPQCCINFPPTPQLMGIPMSGPPVIWSRIPMPSHSQLSGPRKRIGNAAEEALAAYFWAKQAKLSGPPETDPIHKREEGIKNYLMSLIPDLMNLSDMQLRDFKRKVLHVIDNVGEPSQPRIHSNPPATLDINVTAVLKEETENM